MLQLHWTVYSYEQYDTKNNITCNVEDINAQLKHKFPPPPKKKEKYIYYDISYKLYKIEEQFPIIVNLLVQISSIKLFASNELISLFTTLSHILHNSFSRTYFQKIAIMFIGPIS